MKKSKIASGLAGIILATSPITLQNCSTPGRTYAQNSINNTEMLNKESDSKYKIQGTVYFSKKGEGFYKTQNLDHEEGELGFVLHPEDETTILEKPNGQIEFMSEDYNTSSQYIPTKMISQNEKNTLTIFELNNLPKDIERKLMKISNRLEKKNRKDSRNIVGHTYEIFEKDLQKILPMENVEGENFVYVNSKWGNFIDTTNQNPEKVSMAYPDGRKPILLTKENQLSWGINPKTKTIVLTNPDGFYNPVKENLQTNINETKKEKTEETLYDTYTIKKDDTFWGIAEKELSTGKDHVKIQKMNPELNPNNLPVGKEIKIPQNN